MLCSRHLAGPFILGGRSSCFRLFISSGVSLSMNVTQIRSNSCVSNSAVATAGDVSTEGVAFAFPFPLSLRTRDVLSRFDKLDLCHVLRHARSRIVLIVSEQHEIVSSPNDVDVSKVFYAS